MIHFTPANILLNCFAVLGRLMPFLGERSVLALSSLIRVSLSPLISPSCPGLWACGDSYSKTRVKNSAETAHASVSDAPRLCCKVPL